MEQKAIDEARAQMQNMALMNQIVANMKEIPELPSEKPQDVHALQKVEFPEGGGILTYMEGYEHPYKGFPYFEFVDKIDVIKKILRGTLSSFYHSLKARSKVQLLTLALVPWLFNDYVKASVYAMYRQVGRFRIKPERYCTAIRELHRAMSKDQVELTSTREMRLMLRDIMCMLLEFDNAYRYRFQDVMTELDKAALERNPSKEIMRLLKLMQSREQTQEIRDTWSLVAYFFPIYLPFNKPLRNNLIAVLTDLDLKEIALDVQDRQYAGARKDYKFSFMQ